MAWLWRDHSTHIVDTESRRDYKQRQREEEPEKEKDKVPKKQDYHKKLYGWEESEYSEDY